MKRIACVLALAAGTGLAAGMTAQPAYAEMLANPTPSGLQLSLNAAGVTAGDSMLALDVRFEGGNLRAIELVVDGVTVKKKNLVTRTSQGHIEFQIDAALLSEGAHEILVKALDADGNSATATTQVKVNGVGNSGLVRFQFPKNKTMVQGTLPIQVKLDPSIRSPYVSFFVDNNFLGLTNYAPFTFNWDSTHATNGVHTVSVEVYDGETLAKVKSTSLQITVNNPGGLTTRQNETPDLNKPKTNGVQTPATGVQEAVDAVRQSALPHSNMVFQTPQAVMSHLLAPTSTNALRFSDPRMPSSSPLANGSRTTAFPVPPVQVQSLNAVKPLPGAKTLFGPSLANHERNTMSERNIVASVTKPGLLGMVATPREFAGLSKRFFAPRLDSQNLRPRRSGNIAARPSLSMDEPSVHSGVVSPAVRPVLNASAQPAVTRIARSERAIVGPGAITGKGHTLQVAFDNTRIAFDVQPRVEHGLPLAPFRQIFEHTGGTIQWFNQSKTLRAFNSSREIEFKIGQDEAKVNNQSVKMDAKSYIEKGRTIVPLTFVRDALDVNLSYDAKTGHLRIESKK